MQDGRAVMDALGRPPIQDLRKHLFQSCNKSRLVLKGRQRKYAVKGRQIGVPFLGPIGVILNENICIGPRNTYKERYTEMDINIGVGQGLPHIQMPRLCKGRKRTLARIQEGFEGCHSASHLGALVIDEIYLNRGHLLYS